MKITDDLIARFVTSKVTFEEFNAVLSAAKKDLEVAEKVIMGFLAVRFVTKLLYDMDNAIDKAIEKATEEAMEKAAEEALRKAAENADVN